MSDERLNFLDLFLNRTVGLTRRPGRRCELGHTPTRRSRGAKTQHCRGKMPDAKNLFIVSMTRLHWITRCTGEIGR
jgi:hypothetical protein